MKFGLKYIFFFQGNVIENAVYLNQCWIIFNWTTRKKSKFQSIQKLLAEENGFRNDVYKMTQFIQGLCVCLQNDAIVFRPQHVNTLRPRQNGRHFADDTFNSIFVNENVRISIEFSLKFVPKRSINNIPALVQIMAWRRWGDKPLSEPMMVDYRRIYASLGLNELSKLSHKLTGGYLSGYGLSQWETTLQNNVVWH